MNYEDEINALAAESLAIQAVVSQILRRMYLSGGATCDHIRGGFNEAADLVENLALQHGAHVSPHHLAKALKVVEDLREAVLGREEPLR